MWQVFRKEWSTHFRVGVGLPGALVLVVSDGFRRFINAVQVAVGQARNLKTSGKHRYRSPWLALHTSLVDRDDMVPI